MLKHFLTALCLMGALLTTAFAETKTETYLYKSGDAEMEGYIAWDDAIEGKRPVVLVVHDWTGLNEQAQDRARRLAELGYVGFAVDVYGKGIRASNPTEARELATKYRSGDRANLRERMNDALAAISKHELVDSERVGAIGFCFGGTAVLELARSGADVDGVVSFHGGLSTPKPEDAAQIKGKVLVLHGADDPGVNDEEVAGFMKEMRDAKVDWQLYSFGGAVHSFTNPKAGNDPSRGNAYDEKTDLRATEAMRDFFAELFPED